MLYSTNYIFSLPKFLKNKILNLNHDKFDEILIKHNFHQIILFCNITIFYL